MLFCDDDISCHFERSEKSKEFKIRFVFGYFACAQYDKAHQYDKKTSGMAQGKFVLAI